LLVAATNFVLQTRPSPGWRPSVIAFSGCLHMASAPPPLDIDSPTVQTHLSTLQGVVNRQAGNSASCKTWCVSLVSALAVFAASANKANLLIVAAAPIMIFAALDVYYLALERRFRDRYIAFSRRLQLGTATLDDVFADPPSRKRRLPAIASFSIWPFYLGLWAILWFLGRRLT